MDLLLGCLVNYRPIDLVYTMLHKSRSQRKLYTTLLLAIMNDAEYS